MFLKIFQVSSDEGMGKLSKLVDFFQLEIFFKFLLAWFAHGKQNILTSQPCSYTPMQTRLSANQSARTILVIL